jgi:hypothetical protein
MIILHMPHQRGLFPSDLGEDAAIAKPKGLFAQAKSPAKPSIADS